MRIWCRALRNQVKVLVCFCLSNACPPSAGLLLPGDWWPFSLFSKRSPMLCGAEADTRGRTEGSAPENQEHTCFILKFYHSPGSQWVDQTFAQGLFSLLLKGFLIIPCLLLISRLVLFLKSPQARFATRVLIISGNNSFGLNHMKLLFL